LLNLRKRDKKTNKKIKEILKKEKSKRVFNVNTFQSGSSSLAS